MISAVLVLAQRIAALLVLALWLAPSLGAVGIGLHVALDHHGSHGEHPAELPDSLDHRHEHDLDSVLDREQSATIPSKSFSPDVQSHWIDPHPVDDLEESLGLLGSDVRQTSRHGPPPELFTTLCIWLL